MGRVKIDENNIFTVLTIGASLLLLVLAVGGLLLVSRSFAAGVVAGGLLAIANCHWLHAILRRAMRLPARQAVRFAQLRYLLRLAIIAVLVSLLILYVHVGIFGLILGLSVPVITIMAVTVYMATTHGG
ncbi:MAG: ATP synthase subunit I [Geobacteraceae bacterium]|nr:ATP synthase subunit I [Geobacteraceae bacterium]